MRAGSMEHEGMAAGVICWQADAAFGRIRFLPSRPADYLDRWGCKQGYRRIIAGLALAIILVAGAAFAAPALALDPSKAFSQYVQSSWGLQNGLQQKSV